MARIAKPAPAVDGPTASTRGETMQYYDSALVSQPFSLIGSRLDAEVAATGPKLHALPDAYASAPRAPGKWSRKQILGHLIDSAANNHQRFVRAQSGGTLRLPGYAQEHWVLSQGYAERDWVELVDFWCAYNRHLAHVIARIAEALRDLPCEIGDDRPVSLSHVALDYVGHLQHHRGQILDRSSAGDTPFMPRQSP